MGGHGHENHLPTNENNIRENDEEMPLKIRQIDLIKYNPNLFHMWIFDPSNIFNTLGGFKYAITASTGAFLSYYYY